MPHRLHEGTWHAWQPQDQDRTSRAELGPRIMGHRGPNRVTSFVMPRRGVLKGRLKEERVDCRRGA